MGFNNAWDLSSITGIGTVNNVFTSNGAGVLPTFQAVAGAGGFVSIVRQVFTSDGTYTPTANMKYCDVEVVGGGGGSGGSGDATYNISSAGGGGAGYARKVFTAAAIGASQAVTIGLGGIAGASNSAGGAGGATTFGALLTGNGGGGSDYAEHTHYDPTGGAAGTGVGGDVNLTGSMGGQQQTATHTGAPTELRLGGFGGASFLGGQVGGGPGGEHTGNAGVTYGGGAGGASSNAGTSHSGGAGYGGICIITEYCS